MGTPPPTMLPSHDLNGSMKNTKNIFDKLPIYFIDVFPRKIHSYSLGRLEKNIFCFSPPSPSLCFSSLPPNPISPSLPSYLFLPPFSVTT